MASLANEYSEIGNPKGILTGIDVNDPRERDPVEVCLPGKFMNAATITNIDSGMCPKFMVQRCSAKWDKYCNVYFNETLKPSEMDQQLFLDQVTDDRFCRLNPDTLGASNCKVLQQLFDETMPNSPIITTSIGNIVYTSDPLSGYKIIEGCPRKCDKVINADKDKSIEDDPLFKRCINEKSDKDPCRSVIDNVCFNHFEGKYTIKSDKLMDICNTRRNDLNKFNKELKTIGLTKEKYLNTQDASQALRENFSLKTTSGKSISIVIIIAIVSILCFMKFKKN
jgi:hypothetical protein